MSVLFISLVQMLKHKRKAAGRAYTVLSLDIFIQGHVCNLTYSIELSIIGSRYLELILIRKSIFY